MKGTVLCIIFMVQSGIKCAQCAVNQVVYNMHYNKSNEMDNLQEVEKESEIVAVKMVKLPSFSMVTFSI